MTSKEPFSNQPPHQKCINCLYFIKAVTCDTQTFILTGLSYCRLKPQSFQVRATSWCGEWLPMHECNESECEELLPGLLEEWEKERERIAASQPRPGTTIPVKRKPFWKRWLGLGEFEDPT